MTTKLLIGFVIVCTCLVAYNIGNCPNKSDIRAAWIPTVVAFLLAILILCIYLDGRLGF